MSTHDKTGDHKEKAQEASVTPIDWHHARSQPRVRPQWDPRKFANELLDEMERNGRLPSSKRRS